MARIDPQHLAWCLEQLAEGHVVNRIVVPPAEAALARLALDRMLLRCPDVPGGCGGLAAALTLLATAAALPALAAANQRGASATASGLPPAEVRVQSEVNMLYVNASVAAPAPAAACYAVLTDYERLPEFVPGMRSSRVVSQPGEMLKVEQVGAGGPVWLGITVRTVLGLTLTPPAAGVEGRIDFGSYGGNLRQMYGSWVVRRGGWRLPHRLPRDTWSRDFPVPALIGPFLMRRQIEGQLDAIAREITRRQTLPAKPGRRRPSPCIVTPEQRLAGHPSASVFLIMGA
jgi:hypothetical protein